MLRTFAIGVFVTDHEIRLTTEELKKRNNFYINSASLTPNTMPADNFKDRVYHVEQETDAERQKRETEEAEQEKVDGLRSAYGEHGRAYGNWIPGTRSKVEKTTS